VAFCKWLSRKEGKTYRLPTEAEWEYACRAGSKTRYYYGDDPEALAKCANVADGAAKAKFPNWKQTITASDGYVFTAPVGQFKPNAFDLYDMHGNVWQWCEDQFDGDYYEKSPTDDPKNLGTGTVRAIRGGAWFMQPRFVRSAARLGADSDARDVTLGFRVAVVK
jgi:formylglycine-generating enzyme